MKKFILGAAMSVLLSTAAHAETVGVSMALFDDNFLTVLRNGMQDYAKTLDGVTLQVFDAGSHVPVARLRARAAPGAIAECRRVDGEWEPVGFRTDKATANDMFTYRKTLLNISEALTPADIKRAWPNPPPSSSRAS